MRKDKTDQSIKSVETVNRKNNRRRNIRRRSSQLE
jgi:hypothetical protein